MPNTVQDHFMELMKWVLSPEVLTQIGFYIGIGGSIIGFGTKVFKKLWANLEKTQNDELASLKASIQNLTTSVEKYQKDTERELLRIQIITGIHSDRLSVQEVLALYDIYSSKGYNSYVSRVVHDYVEEKRQEGRGLDNDSQ